MKKTALVFNLLILALAAYFLIPITGSGRSMPSLHNHQLALRTTDVHTGDIVQYFSKERQYYIVHRVVVEQKDDLEVCGEWDYSGKPFCEWIEKKDVIGKVILDF